MREPRPSGPGLVTVSAEGGTSGGGRWRSGEVCAEARYVLVMLVTLRAVRRGCGQGQVGVRRLPQRAGGGGVLQGPGGQALAVHTAAFGLGLAQRDEPLLEQPG